jgi:hypothetical protein
MCNRLRPLVRPWRRAGGPSYTQPMEAVNCGADRLVVTTQGPGHYGVLPPVIGQELLTTTDCGGLQRSEARL